MAPLVAYVDIGLVLGIVVPIGSLLIVAMTAIITNHYRKLQHDDMEATLKMEMIQRGMAAEDIERVLAARMGKFSKRRRGSQGSYQEPRQYQQRHGAGASGR